MIVAATLLPIAPLILLPFAIIFFVLVFPFWLVGVALLWILYQLVRLTSGAESSPSKAMYRAFRWVLTFGGLAKSQAEREAQAAATRR